MSRLASKPTGLHVQWIPRFFPRWVKWSGRDANYLDYKIVLRTVSFMGTIASVMVRVVWNNGGMFLQGTNELLGEKAAPVPLCPPRISI